MALPLEVLLMANVTGLVALALHWEGVYEIDVSSTCPLYGRVEGKRNEGSIMGDASSTPPILFFPCG